MNAADMVVKRLRSDGFIAAAMNGVKIEQTMEFQEAETVAKELTRLRSINTELVQALETALAGLDAAWEDEPVAECCESCNTRIKLKAALARAKEMK
jgi:hypothetical protein